MRRDRLLAKTKKTREDYDDLAVAYDKLGDPTSALRWIDRKPRGDAESRYRTLANRGTFLVHAWLRGKADSHHAREGLENLKQAVALNPNAHFGRESVQIKLIEAFLDPEHAAFDTTYGSYPEGDRAAEKKRESEGYAGIIRLGAGWESPDVFRVFAASLGATGYGAIGTAALDRAEELEAKGLKPRLDPERTFPLIEQLQEQGALREDTLAQFRRLRNEADRWQARRTAFMLGRLKAGRHPDTDPTFWQGWRDGSNPKVSSDIVRFRGIPMTRRSYVALIGAIALFLAVPIGIGLTSLWIVRRRTARVRAL